MPTITVHITDEEKEFLVRMAKHERRSLSDLLKTTTLASLEDKYDAQLGDVAFNEYLKNPQSRPLVESLEEYGLGESD
ncbi:toxin-antitoxin system, antitoxin component [Tetragenococcus halophilus]|uniref:type II toxin-antitoxin system RelB family antitoxin n=1 Tax=Tetragenococcus TaxID=51668 RepID=UPI001C7663AB|nr:MULTISPECIES: DUF6290 family protein [Tetragenococcus]MDN6571139.1 DUF6290 family protein [Staphylococcus equorum]MCF1618183.1 DUF6290 family protein [Tetragenococcus koreensis]MCF1622799.1 DUF6290 family protein [Tetragenococcus koreensis]MCF1632814.1 DUF6290 family protein [Tetragenococcus koreensis]MCF1643115.1 DUF6290 family protein [Tetragenococcus koreensis]